MDNAANVNSGTESQAAPAAPAMKSTDTGTLAQSQASEPAKPAAKPAPAQAETSDAGAGDTGETGEGAGHDASSADAATKGKPDRLPRWVQERMARVRETTARETEDRIRRELGERQQAPRQDAAPPVNVGANPDAKPKTLADFNFNEDAYFDYKVEQGMQREAQRREAQETERKQREAAEQFTTKIDAFETRVGAGAWEDIVTSPLNTDPAFKPLTDLFMGDEHDLDIALYLASNITEANRINALPRLQQVREVAKLAEQFAGEDAGESQAQAATTPPPLPKKLTTAPPPPKTLSNAGKSSKSVDDDSISTADRIALWQAKKQR